MLWLILGVALWSGVHLLPSVAQGLKAQLVTQMGENAYKGLFSLGLIAAIVLMVIGWRSAEPTFVYQTYAWGAMAATPLMIVAFLLFGFANIPSTVKRFIRHPQLTAIATWAAAHLISNGDSRSLVLFGGLGLWALIEMPLINRREGAWEKPYTPPLVPQLRAAAISIVIFIVVFLLHPYFTGVPLI